MDEVKDKFKGFMKKVSASSSSSRFHGQGRVLGSSSSSSPPHNNQIPNRQSNPPPTTKPKPPSPKPSVDPPAPGSNPDPKPRNGFDPLITSAKTSKSGWSLETLECPICWRAFTCEQQLSDHVDVCSSNSAADDLEASVRRYLSGNPAPASIEVVLRLLKNVAREPENPKFRRLRMSNAKIKEAVSDVAGGSELLESVGFEFKEEEDREIWAIMDAPSEDRIVALTRASQLLEPKTAPSSEAPMKDQKLEPKKIDRQTKVFFSVSENVASEIVLPDSFFKLSVEEVRREALSRKKNLEDSRLLVPKTLKEKQAKATRKKYTKTIIRIQFPDGVVLQAVFNPWEPTSSLYKFVSSALKEPGLEFELLHPAVVKRRVIPCFSAPGKNAITLEAEDLVPSALVKFRPIEPDSLLFTGLRNDLLEISEPLGS